MIGRLQFRYDEKLYASKSDIEKMLNLNAIQNNYQELTALYAEPIVFKYGTSNYKPNLVLAIGAYGNGISGDSRNNYFLIDTATLEQDVQALKAHDIVLDKNITDILASIETIKSDLDTETRERKENDDILSSGVTTLIEALSAETKERVDADKDLEHNKVSHSDLHFEYDEDKKEIVLSVWHTEDDHKVEEYSESIDCKQFIKDGMLDSVEYLNGTHTDESGNTKTGVWLVLTWNTDAGKTKTYLSVSDLISIYKIADASKTYLEINDNEINVINVDNVKGLASFNKVWELYKTLDDKIESSNDDVEDRIDDLEKEDIRLDGKIGAETTNRINADLEHDREIIALNSGLTTAVNDYNNKINDEISQRKEDVRNLTLDKIAYNDVVFTYDQDNKTLVLESNGYNPNFHKEIPVSDFIKGGFIQKVSVVDNPESEKNPGSYLEILWNTLDGKSSTTYISLNRLFDVYTVESGSTNYLAVKKYELYAKVDTPNGLASVPYVKSVEEAINENLSELADAVEDITYSIDEVSERYSGNTNEIQNVKNKAITNADLRLVHTNGSIKLIGKDGSLLSEVPTQEFVKDGMLKQVLVDDENNLVLIWNTDAGDTTTKVPLEKFVNTYDVDEESEKYLTIDNYTFKLKVDVDGGLASYKQVHLLTDDLDYRFDVIVGLGFSGYTLTHAIDMLSSKVNNNTKNINSLTGRVTNAEKDIVELSSVTEQIQEQIGESKDGTFVVAETFSNLTSVKFWKEQGVVLKDGMAVSVKDERAIYILTDANSYDESSSWVMATGKIDKDENVSAEKVILNDESGNTKNLVEVINDLLDRIDYLENNCYIDIQSVDKDIMVTSAMTENGRVAYIEYKSTTNE